MKLNEFTTSMSPLMPKESFCAKLRSLFTAIEKYESSDDMDKEEVERISTLKEMVRYFIDKSNKESNL